MINQEEIYLEMDGKEIGIEIFSYKTEKMLKEKNGEDIVCTNINQARLAAIKSGLTNPLDYDFFIKIKDSEIIMHYFDFIKGQYQMVSDDDKMYYVKPVEKFSIEKLGYIIFNNNTRNFINSDEDKERIYKIAEDNFASIKEATNKLVKYPNREAAILSVDRFWSNIAVKVKNTSGIIHILYNSQIMNINMNRKNAGLRSFRFDPNMDKYNTLYFFIHKDFNESDSYKSIETSMKALQMIVDEARKTRPDIQLRYIDLSVPMEIDNNIIRHNMKKVRREKEDDKSDKS